MGAAKAQWEGEGKGGGKGTGSEESEVGHLGWVRSGERRGVQRDQDWEAGRGEERKSHRNYEQEDWKISKGGRELWQNAAEKRFYEDYHIRMGKEGFSMVAMGIGLDPDQMGPSID